MKLVTFRLKNELNIGFVLQDDVFILKPFYEFYKEKNNIKNDVSIPNDMKTLIENSSLLNELKKVVKFAEENTLDKEDKLKDIIIPLSDSGLKLTAPILNPQKIVAIGQNYMDHIREQKIDPPKKPVIFAKYASSIIGHNDVVTWEPELTQQVDFEAELAVVIGKKAKNVKKEDAFDYVAGYTCINDISARDLQFSDGQWVRGKSLDTFCPMGPWLVTKEEVQEPQNLSIKCTVNGNVYQDSNTREMIFKIPELISYVSNAFTLLPGDIISTGTPNGVGAFRDPKIFLKPGDKTLVEIEGIGSLFNTVG